MKNLECFKEKKVLRIFLLFFSGWYLISSVVALCTLFLCTFLYVSEGSIGGRVVFVSVVFLVKTLIYVTIARSLVRYFEIDKNEKKLQLVSVCFLILFALDLVSLFTGDFNENSTNAAKLLLELLSTESWYNEGYSRIFLYVPAVYDFLKPQLEGVTLLLLSVITGYLARYPSSTTK